MGKKDRRGGVRDRNGGVERGMDRNIRDEL